MQQAILIYDMSEINISKINLNLLNTLDILLSEVNVSRAAERLDVSQSAMSHSLNQLRIIFNDKLLIRGQSGKMSLTPYALMLEPKVKIAISGIKDVFLGEKLFDPTSASDTFFIGMTDYASMVLLPKLTAQLQKEAPRIRLVIRHINKSSDLTQFETGKLNLAIGNFPKDITILYKQRLFTDEIVCVAHKSHPAFKKASFTIDNYMNYPHILVGMDDQPDKSAILNLLQKNGYKIQAYEIVANYLMALYPLVPNSDFIASTVRRVVENAPNHKDLIIKPFPKILKLRTVITSQLWHPRYADDPSHIWLRNLIKKTADSL